MDVCEVIQCALGKTMCDLCKTDMWAASMMWRRQNCTLSGKIDADVLTNIGIASHNLPESETDNINEVNDHFEVDASLG